MDIAIPRHPERMFMAKVPYGPKVHMFHICYKPITPGAQGVQEIVSKVSHSYMHERCIEIATSKVAEIAIE